jgi:hypothetical protein
MERNKYGKIVEDCGLAIQKFDETGNTREAELVRLVSMHHMGDMAYQLEDAESPVHRLTVLDAALLVLQQQSKKSIPLVSLGQGDYRKDYYAEEQSTPVKRRAGLNAFRSLIWRGQR